MPDGRMMSRSITTSEQLGSVSLEADFLFGRCVPHLDRDGRMSGNPDLLKAAVCPLRSEIPAAMIPHLLAELASMGLIRWYEADGKQVIDMPGFKRHQRSAKLDRETPSRFLPYSTDYCTDLKPPTPDLVRTNSGPTSAQVPLSEVK